MTVISVGAPLTDAASATSVLAMMPHREWRLSMRRYQNMGCCDHPMAWLLEKYADCPASQSLYENLEAK